MRLNIRPYSELRIVLAATEQEAYNFVYKGESKEEFFFWLQLHDPKKTSKIRLEAGRTAQMGCGYVRPGTS
jgi:hypothetical protein